MLHFARSYTFARGSPSLRMGRALAGEETPDSKPGKKVFDHRVTPPYILEKLPGR